MIEHGSGGAAYYADVMEAVVALAVDPPAGPAQEDASQLRDAEFGLRTAHRAFAMARNGPDKAPANRAA
jgi:hypothetical protein